MGKFSYSPQLLRGSCLGDYVDRQGQTCLTKTSFIGKTDLLDVLMISNL